MLEEDKNQEIYKNMHFRMYKNKYPDKDEHVYVNQINIYII